MRIISQDGMFDLPYEIARIFVKSNFCPKIGSMPIVKYETECLGIVIASYNTMDNAHKAMDLLHKAYIGEILKYTADDDEWVPLHDGMPEWVITPNKESYIVSNAIDNRIFRFPSDDEISKILEGEKDNG